MNKYIVKICFINGNSDIVLVKAKNIREVEYKVAKEIQYTFDSFNDIEDIEIEKITRKAFSKKCYWFIPTAFTGGNCLEECLKNEIHKN